MLWVLDSTVLIDYLRGRPTVERVSALAENGDLLATTAVNVEEIVRGLRPAEVGAATELFAGLEVLSVDLAGLSVDLDRGGTDDRDRLSVGHQGRRRHHQESGGDRGSQGGDSAPEQ